MKCFVRFYLDVETFNSPNHLPRSYLAIHDKDYKYLIAYLIQNFYVMYLTEFH